MLRLAFVDGATPAKWARIWAQRRPDVTLELRRVPQREQLVALRSGFAEIAIVRLPIEEDGLAVIPLYSEVVVAVAPTDHAIAALEELSVADLVDEQRVSVTEDLTDAQVMELVAAGLGIALLPHSIARLHARKDVIARPVTDAPQTRIALAWPTAATSPEVEEFIGVVRGRTANSSRGAAVDTPAAVTTAVKPQAAQTKAGQKGKQKTAKQETQQGNRGKRHPAASRGRRRRG